MSSPFTLNDFYLFGERDAAAHPDRYTRPDFWLYYPTDQKEPYDQPMPTCRTDYLTGLVRGLGVGRPASDIDVSPLWVASARARPGSIVTVGGVVSHSGGRQLQAELLRDGLPIAPAFFNCQDGVFLGEYQIPPTTPTGPLTFAARLTTPDGQIISVGEGTGRGRS